MAFCYRVPTSSKFSSKCLIIKVGVNPAGITKEKQVLDNQVLVFLFYHELMALADVNA